MKTLCAIIAAAFLCQSCVDVLNEDTATHNLPSQIPDWFDYSTTYKITVKAQVLDNKDYPLQGVALEYAYANEGKEISLGTATTDKNGNSHLNGSIPSYIDSIIIKNQYLGLPQKLSFAIREGDNNFTIGGISTPVSVKGGASGGRINSAFSYASTYDGNGVPANLEPANDHIPQDLLDLINNTLPERRPVPQYNPEYLSSTTNPNTELKELADIWVTFVSEGAGYRNALGYYTYDIKSPPQSVNDISKFTVIFPNVSFAGSGGNLSSGNKVHLGRFPANTGIGWFLVPNGWNGTSVVAKPEIKYSNKEFNTYTTSQYRQQVVLLKDDARELLLLGFEDLSRPGGDNDFNDAVFFVTASPYSAVITNSLTNTKNATGTDSDGDGVIDRNDGYPLDASKAFDLYSPGENQFGSLAFEDQWPNKGDYDMNDLVVDYNFQMITNTANAAVECRANFYVKAVGAMYHNGFGIELPIASNLIQSVSVSLDQTFTIQKNSNGTEAGQSKAVIILFEDAHQLFNSSGLINTKVEDSYRDSVKIEMTMVFTQPIKMTNLGYAPFNPFIFVNGDRTVEVHLPNMEPTQKADTSILGTFADSSNPALGRYYKAGDNMPWAINLPSTFDYPRESRPINSSFIMFAPWAKSGGTDKKDWYLEKTGYRTTNSIYSK